MTFSLFCFALLCFCLHFALCHPTMHPGSLLTQGQDECVRALGVITIRLFRRVESEEVLPSRSRTKVHHAHIVRDAWVNVRSATKWIFSSTRDEKRAIVTIVSSKIFFTLIIWLSKRYQHGRESRFLSMAFKLILVLPSGGLPLTTRQTHINLSCRIAKKLTNGQGCG